MLSFWIQRFQQTVMNSNALYFKTWFLKQKNSVDRVRESGNWLFNSKTRPCCSQNKSKLEVLKIYWENGLQGFFESKHCSEGGVWGLWRCSDCKKNCIIYNLMHQSGKACLWSLQKQQCTHCQILYHLIRIPCCKRMCLMLVCIHIRGKMITLFEPKSPAASCLCTVCHSGEVSSAWCSWLFFDLSKGNCRSSQASRRWSFRELLRPFGKKASNQTQQFLQKWAQGQWQDMCKKYAE